MATYRAYARISTETQSDASIEVQRDFLKNQHINNFPSYEFAFYHEKQSGSTIEKRPQLLRLLSDLKPGDILGFYDNSRLGRDTLNNHLVLIEANGKKAQVEIGGRLLNPNSPEDQLQFSIHSAISKYYRQSQHEKSRMGIEKKKLNGDWIFSGRLYGYQVISKNGKIEVSIIEEEAEVIRFIFLKYSEGLSIYKITNLLNAEGRRSRKNTEFTYTAIRRFLLKPIYMGKYPLSGPEQGAGNETIMKPGTKMITSNYYEPIVDEELWYKVFNSYKRLTRKHKNQYSYRWSGYELSSIIKCHYCNITYVHSYFKKSYHTNENYACRSHKDGCKQTWHTFRKEIVEKLFRELFKLAFIFKERIFFFEENKTKELKKSKNEIELKLEDLQQQIDATNKKLDHLVEAIKSGIVIEKIRNEIGSENEKLEKLVDQKNVYANKLQDIDFDLDDMIADFAEKRLFDFFSGTPQERRVFYTEYITYCTVQDDVLRVHFIHDIFIEVTLVKNKGRIMQKIFPIKIYSVIPENEELSEYNPLVSSFTDPDGKEIRLQFIANGSVNTADGEVLIPEFSDNTQIMPEEAAEYFAKHPDEKHYTTKEHNLHYSRNDLLFRNARIKQMQSELKQINNMIIDTVGMVKTEAAVSSDG